MTASQLSLDGKLAVVTGASQGIGRAIALSLARLGATVCIVGRFREKLDEVTRATAAGFLQLVEADLADDNDLRRLAVFVEHEFQRTDILVHCAGLYGRGTLADTPIEHFDRLYRVNVRAPYLLSQLLLPRLITNRGQIVFLNSTQGLNASPGVGQYAATQHALRAIADSLRAEVNERGVRVLSVYPGRTATPRMAQIFEQEQRPYQPQLLLQPDDIASVVVNALLLPRTAEATDISIRSHVKSY